MSGSWNKEEFPNLQESDFKITSDKSTQYNCISWAAEDATKRWDPDQMEQFFWPPNVPREVTMQAVVRAYGTIGYEVCESPIPEEGFQKIALYASSDGSPTHAARLLENGRWTSKLGDYEDIEHTTLDCLNGSGTECYGSAVLYLKRRIPHPG